MIFYYDNEESKLKISLLSKKFKLLKIIFSNLIYSPFTICLIKMEDIFK